MYDPKVMHDHSSAIGSNSWGQSWLQTLIDSSHIITFCVSISVIIYASFKSLNIDWDNDQTNQSDDENSKQIESKNCQDSEAAGLGQQQTQDIGAAHALLIPLAASMSLLLMFFFFDSIQTIFLLCTSILAIVTFAFLLLPLCSMVFKFFCATCPHVYTRKYSLCFCGEFTLPELLAQLLSSCLVGLWILTGHWLLMDIIGIGFCITFIAIVRLPSLKVSTLLLCGLVIYDVFWVYFSHFIFSSNVMVKVATNEANNPFKSIAKHFNMDSALSRDSMPKLSLPGKLIVPSYQNTGNFSILGLGDIVVPGLLLCFVLRFDAYKRSQLMQALKLEVNSNDNDDGYLSEVVSETVQPHKLTCDCFDCKQRSDLLPTCDFSKMSCELKNSRDNQVKLRRSRTFPFVMFPLSGHQSGDKSWHEEQYTFANFLKLKQISYFHCAIVGYFLGLLTATLSSEIFREAQPALLFLVPFTLAPLLIMAYLKGDLMVMWNEPFTNTTPKYFYV